jgi:Sec7-like guanine-nucleotide exchange factor
MCGCRPAKCVVPLYWRAYPPPLLDTQKRQKEETLRAAIRFKSKPRDGIAHLVRIGRCEDTPESIAAVFHTLEDVLDKTMMGDYMGGEKDMNIKVMPLCTPAYVILWALGSS